MISPWDTFSVELEMLLDKHGLEIANPCGGMPLWTVYDTNGNPTTLKTAVFREKSNARNSGN